MRWVHGRRICGLGLLVLAWAASVEAAVAAIPICPPLSSGESRNTCVFDGDTGWYRGRQWQLADIDAPDVSARYAQCRAEQKAGLKALGRLRELMAPGYTIFDTGRRDGSQRPLVRIKLQDGRDAGIELLSEGLVRAWPNRGNPWCNR